MFCSLIVYLSTLNSWLPFF